MYIKSIVLLTLFALISCRKINDAGFQIIKEYEGFHANFYIDLYVISLSQTVYFHILQNFFIRRGSILLVMVIDVSKKNAISLNLQ